MEYLEKSASLSPCGRYRYGLYRRWQRRLTCRTIYWCLLNPSLADGAVDDATVRKVVGFSDRWGYGAASIVNLVPWRATDPYDVIAAHRAGHDVMMRDVNDLWLTSGEQLVVGWGDRVQSFRAAGIPVDPLIGMLTFGGLGIECLRVTAAGNPHHPCRLPYDQADRQGWPT